MLKSTPGLALLLVLLFFASPLCAAGSDALPAAVDLPESARQSIVSRAGAEPRGVSLRQIEVLAMQNNLDLRTEEYTARASTAQLEKSYGLYDPQLELSLSTGQQRDAANSEVFTGMTGRDTVDYSASLSQTIASGATLGLSLDSAYRDTFTEPPPALNPEHSSQLTFSLVQPLLKGFGSLVTEQQIRFATVDQRISLQDLRTRAFTVLGDVRNSYYAAIRSRDELAYRRSSVELARRIVEENRARVEVGAMARVELLEAEVGLESRQRDLLDAERSYRDNLDTLALQVNSRELLEPADAGLLALTVPIDEQLAFDSALQSRPELLRRGRELERIDLERQVNSNSLLPALDLSASYSQKGVTGDFGDTYADVAGDDLRSWQVGVNFSLPLGNRAAKGELLASELRLRGKQAELEQLREAVRNEIRAAIRAIDLARSKMQVATRGKQLAEEKLQILIGRKDVGLATTRDVLQGEEDLALANTDLIAAVADYNNALTSYLQVSGQLLEHEGFILGEVSSSTEAATPFSYRQP